MRKHILALMAGGLLMGSVGAATAQEMALRSDEPLTKPKNALMVFTEKGDRALSPTALSTIRTAADKARDGRTVMLTGSPRDIVPVRDELVRQGVSASLIVNHSDTASPMPRARDGLDAVDRHVQITF